MFQKKLWDGDWLRVTKISWLRVTRGMLQWIVLCVRRIFLLFLCSWDECPFIQVVLSIPLIHLKCQRDSNVATETISLLTIPTLANWIQYRILWITVHAIRCNLNLRQQSIDSTKNYNPQRSLCLDIILLTSILLAVSSNTIITFILHYSNLNPIDCLQSDMFSGNEIYKLI